MIDLGACERPPDRACVLLEEFGGHVREDVEGVALLDQADAFGGQAFELDGSDFGAVLFVLAAALQILVVVEAALRAVPGAVEEVDDGPEQFLDVGLEACAAKVVTTASKMSMRAACAVWPSGRGLGSGSSCGR